jgi:hypothetical protein
VSRVRELPEPTRDEVLRWLAFTGKTAMEAVIHFFPELRGNARRKKSAAIRQWLVRVRSGDIVLRDGPEPITVKDIPKPDLGPKPVSEDEDRISALRRYLRDLESDLTNARRDDQKLIPSLSKRLSEARDEYDKAMERERRVVRLERTPGAISAELARRADAIALRAELWRRRTLKQASKAEEGG